ncbi:MAG TPA: WD40 repeat domain-containing serine/threonine protein kinase, partial [Planctomycetota bacterium]|nr:WD40 repeat domain-containing serine/threonine protein kinase [Planctomycetota bacterium]
MDYNALMAEHPVNERLRIELFNLLVEAQLQGTSRSLDWYVEQFPGHEDFIRSEYSRVASEDVTLAPESFPGTYERRIGRYRLLRELGRGGQGVVYLALDEHLGRQVALKVMAFPSVAHGQLPLRVRRELEAIARLNHEGLAVVHDAFVSDHYVCMAMRYVEGEPLSVAIARAGPGQPADLPELRDDATQTRARPSRHERVAIFIELAARALHSAHLAGVVHRDIKPHNIMVNTRGEPVILDFGLALTGDSELAVLTGTGDLPGTPYTMAPERVRGERSEDPRGDVWSLGVTLYEALTGKRPFEAPTVQALHSQILTTEPQSPKQICPEVSSAIADVTLTALAKEPHSRYASAAALADDLARAITGEPILARPPGPLRKCLRWAYRHPARAASLLLLILALALATLAAVTMRDLAERRDEARRDAEAALVKSLYEQGRATLLAREPGRKSVALDLFLKVAAWNRKGAPLLAVAQENSNDPQAGTKALRDALTEAWLLKDLAPTDSLLGFTAVTGTLAAHAPLGAFPDLASGMENFAVRLVDLRTGRVVQELRDSHLPGQAMRLSPDGEFLAAVTDRGHTLRMWRLPSMELVLTESLERGTEAPREFGGRRPLERWEITIANAGRAVAATCEFSFGEGGPRRSLWVFSPQASPALRMVHHGADVGWPCAFTSDGDTFGTRTGPSELGIWDLKEPHEPGRISLDGELVALRFRTSDPDSFVAIWRAPGSSTDTLGARAFQGATSLKRMNLGGPCGSNSALELSTDGTLLMINDAAGSMRLVDVTTLHVVATLESAAVGHVEGISWHSGNTNVTQQVRGSGTRSYAVDAKPDLLLNFPQLPATTKPDPRLSGADLAFSPTSEKLALFDPARPEEISLWSTENGSLHRTIKGQDQRAVVVQLCWSRDGSHLARMTSPGWYIWDVDDWAARPFSHSFGSSDVTCQSIVSTVAKEFRIAASHGDALKVFSERGQLLRQFPAVSSGAMISLTPNGEALIVAGRLGDEPAILLGDMGKDALERSPWRSGLRANAMFEDISGATTMFLPILGGPELHVVARPLSLAPPDHREPET